jgi:DNA-binding Xre family transcriptional regulator
MAPGTVRLRLSKILKARGLQQKDIAAQTGLSKTAVVGLANEGLRQIRLDTIARLCDTLKIQPGDLFDYNPGTDDEEST